MLINDTVSAILSNYNHHTFRYRLHLMVTYPSETWI